MRHFLILYFSPTPIEIERRREYLKKKNLPSYILYSYLIYYIRYKEHLNRIVEKFIILCIQSISVVVLVSTDLMLCYSLWKLFDLFHIACVFNHSTFAEMCNHSLLNDNESKNTENKAKMHEQTDKTEFEWTYMFHKYAYTIYRNECFSFIISSIQRKPRQPRPCCIVLS